MPASPIVKEITLPDNWVQLQKTMIPDSSTSCYWSVWFDPPTNMKNGTAWLMWCPFGDDPSVNDSWGHVEDLDDSCRNVLNAIESVYGVSFHESIWKEITPEQMLKDNPMVAEHYDGYHGKEDGIEEYCSGTPHIKSCPLYKGVKG